MSSNYSTIQQHSALRVPNEWGREGKAFVVQMEEVLDDIYRRFGRLRLEDMSKEFRKEFSDAEGNISTLQQTAQWLRVDVDNKIAKTTTLQTATDIVTEATSQAATAAGNTYIAKTTTYQDAASIVTAANNYVDGELTNYSTTAQTADAIALYVGNNAYEIVSGISINASGVEITGSKYLKLGSGGTLDINATNFKINSTDKKIVAGNWTFSDSGSQLVVEQVIYPAGGGVIVTDGYFDIKEGKADESRTGPVIGSANYMVISADIDKNDNWKGNMYFYYDWQTGPGSANSLAGIKYDFTTAQAMKILPLWAGTKYTAVSIGSSDKIFSEVYSDYVYYNHLTQMSSREMKHNIQPMESTGERLDRLEPVTFAYNNDAEEKTRMGLIWEDTVGVLPEICHEKDGVKSIDYMELVPMLLKEVQELRQRMKEVEHV